MPKVLAKSPIRYNGRDYAEGRQFTCSDDEANALVKAGAAELVEDSKKEGPPKKE